MGRPRPAVGGSHSHSLDSVPSPGLGQRKYLCVGVPKGVYSERLLGAKTEIPVKTFYGELTRKIHSIRFDPHGDDFRRFLGQLSWLGLPLFDEELFAAGSSG